MNEDQYFFVGQKAFIEKDGEVLALIAPFGLDFPGGKIQAGETDFTQSIKREVREETGLEIEVGNVFITWCVSVRDGYKNAGKKVYLVGFRCTYLSGDIKLSNEHVDCKWVNKNNYKEVYEDNMTFKALEKYFEEK